MTAVSKKIMGGGLLAAIGLSALSPVQQAGVALSVAGAAMWASPALAVAGIPGVGLVIKKKPGNAPIVVPSDANGEVRLAGLEPGEYEVKLLGNSAPVTMEVGRDGKLAFVAQRDVKGGPTPRSADPRARRALPVVREWVERCCDNTDNWDKSAFDVRDMQMPDVNTSTAEELMAGTNISRKAAAFIIEERRRGGLYKDPLNFAQRVGGSVTVDFGYSSARIGDTTIIAKGLNPKNPGFKMVKGSGVVEVYGKKHNYVGHVTLLR